MGGKPVKNCKIKKVCWDQKKYFQSETDKISSEQLRKLEKIKPFGHIEASNMRKLESVHKQVGSYMRKLEVVHKEVGGCTKGSWRISKIVEGKS